MKKFMDLEPLRVYYALRVVLYLAAGAGLLSLAPEHVEPILIVLGVLLGIDTKTTQDARAKVMSPNTTETIVSGLFITESGRFVRDIVEQLVPKNRLVEALALTASIALEYRAADMTDETRAVIQRRVHELLRAAKIVRGLDIKPLSL